MAETKKSRGQKLAEKQVTKIMDYKRTFGSEQGKRVLYDLISNHHVMSSTYTKGDPTDIAFKEGQRQVILRILTLMKVDPQTMQRLIEESNDYVQVS